MNAPIRTLVMRKQGLPETGDTAENEITSQPWFFFVVEDDTDDRMLARRVLEQSPYVGEIICVTSGPELFKALETMAVLDDPAIAERCLILLDIRLVRDNGITLLESLRTHPQTEDMRIVMVTGSTEAGSVEASYRRHANAFIAKPLRAEHLDEIHAVMREVNPRMKVH